MQADQTDAIMQRLRQEGGRATGPRRATVEVLLHAGGDHLSAEDITAMVQRDHPEVAPSTIYRTLSALEDLGVVEHVHLGHGPSTYHLAANHHQHLVCESCGEVTEVPDDEFALLAVALEERYGFSLRLGHFALLGCCRRCAAPASAR
ncbi:MAG TPA: Fur family transcriptional regulator [Acidimicrobiales bacterium]|nr:Fur family transcriptional regulator [Acidimicrobiales bacterium]